MMLEAQAIAEALGVRFPIDVDKRIDGAGGVGAHKTSMLQDLERGRPMEIDALVTAVQELGRLTGMPTPTIDTGAGARPPARPSAAATRSSPSNPPPPRPQRGSRRLHQPGIVAPGSRPLRLARYSAGARSMRSRS